MDRLRYQDLHVNGVDFAYVTTDTVEEVEAPGYFDGVHDRLARLDYIRITAESKTDSPPVAWFRIDKINGKEVLAVRLSDWDRPRELPMERNPRDPDKRVAQIIVGMKQFIKKHPDVKDLDFYTKDGRPKGPLLHPFCGFQVSIEDRDRALSVIHAELERAHEEELMDEAAA